MVNSQYFRYLVWSLLLWISPLCFGQVIRMRVINAENGHPLPKQHISVSLLYEKNEKVPAKYDALLHLETDVDGEARFSLPEPAPAHLSATTSLTSEHWRCGCWALVVTQELIQNGIVEGQKLTTPAMQLKAEPREILFVARRSHSSNGYSPRC